ncbi:hypothetical protein AVEN_85470-1 [Araneus ventricosus]|uniref:Uncharacterized protein n=1 Tax=Araneus ventricosus TaxID=182803 RepID=A0A4Y2X0D3_ARAVE|nr:hypothetical protein AVEN_65656-1 [Araneus ventricosus]GBO43106.1 hypothetical protein AVEN_132426-1 [Araneus ventricosus]GBO45645.1 hypothetical protein AVEN_266184-1 [Araneus ventricosus]GBO45646.1 hypothetical protein AVEN_85470-1 [Araneus ventricosus]
MYRGLFAVLFASTSVPANLHPGPKECVKIPDNDFSLAGEEGKTCGMSITSTKRFPLQLKTSLVFFGAQKQIFSLNRCVRNREYPSFLCTLEAFGGGFSKGAKSIHHWALIGVNDGDVA